MSGGETLRCPVCGVGVVVDLAFDERTDGRRVPKQDPGAREIVTYSCGHDAVGPDLATADPERMEVERRTSEDTVDPTPTDDETATPPRRVPRRREEG